MTAIIETTKDPAQKSEETTYDVTVVERREVGEDTISLSFERVDKADFPAWEPGSHIDLHLGTDADGDPLLRQYSLWSDPAERKRISVGVLKDPNSRGGSVLVHDTLHEGTQLTITGPRNHFKLQEANSYVLFAGGIGITPILAMARQLEQQGKEWKLYYMARNRARLSLLDELAKLPSERVVLHSDEESNMLDTRAITAQLVGGVGVYACGPTPLLDALEFQAGGARGWKFHCERFAALPKPAGQIDLPFDVVLAQSDKTLQVPANKSCLEVLRDAGIEVDWSCKEGTCGTCEVEILAGVPEHRDAVLTAEEREENETMMVCVSRAKTPSITLDI